MRVIGPPRGLLRTGPSPGTHRHERLAPPAALDPFVEHYWYVAWDLTGHADEVRETAPHPNVHLVVAERDTRIFGVHEGRFTRTLSGRGRVFGIKFRAGGFHAFARQPVSVYSNESTPIEAVFGPGAASFEHDVLACAEPAAMAEVATELLAAQRPERDPEADRATALVATVLERSEITSVGALARHAGVSVRALQRSFAQYVGVSPKWVINRYRLHEAIARLAAGAAVDWTTLAHELGYYDQAHFIRDFRKWVGRTPGEFARDETRIV